MSQISVILPTFNRADLIGETLDSLLAQTRRPDEILVIDDGSTDSTPEVLGRYDAEFRVIRQDNAGKATALNRALSEAQGDLIWVVDDDDILLPEACALLAGALEDDPDLGFCAGRHLDFTHDPAAPATSSADAPPSLRAPGYMRDSTPASLFPDLLEGCHIFQPGLMVRKRTYDAAGPFRAELTRSQDYEMLLRIARRHRGRHLSEVVFWHRDHAGVRGQAGQQFDASRNADRWAEFNARIFSELLADLDDHELVPADEWVPAPEPLRPRLARIARGTVMGRQRMWGAALDEFERAAETAPDPLCPAERDRIARATLSSLGCAPLDRDPALWQQLRRLGKQGPAGAEIRSLIRHSMRWRLRAAIETRDLPALRQLSGFFLRS